MTPIRIKKTGEEGVIVRPCPRGEWDHMVQFSQGYPIPYREDEIIRVNELPVLPIDDETPEPSPFERAFLSARQEYESGSHWTPAVHEREENFGPGDTKRLPPHWTG